MQFKFFPVLMGIASLVAVSLPAVAQTTQGSTARSSVLNPCPGIYYEEPHNSLRVVPQGCPPNAATRLLIEQGRIPGSATLPQASPAASPSQQQQTALTAISPQAGRVNVRLRNTMNTQVTYQVIGQTEQRTLAAGQEANLQNLPAPVTVTFVRPDGGFVRVTPTAGAEQGVLAVALNEAIDLNTSQTTLRIQDNGGVFAY